VGPFLDKTDGITPEVALTVTSEKLTFMVDTAGVPTLILDTAPTTSGGANDMVHVTNDDAGFYDLELAAADVNYLGRAMLSLNDVATHCPVFHEFMILPAIIFDAMILGTDLVDVNTAKVNETSQTAGDLAALVTTVDGVVDAIKAKTDNLPAAPADDTSIDTQLGTIAGYLDTEVAAILAAVDTEVAAIKVKTDNLPSDPADESLIEAAITAATSPLATATDLATVDGILDDIHGTDLPAVKTDTAAIKAKTDNLPAAPADDTSIDTQLGTIAGYLDTEVAAILAAVDTEIAAIKAKTDQLIFTIANQVDANALSGGGSGLDAAGVRAAVGLASANLDTQLTAIDDYLDTEIAAIKAKTDNLPSDPADESLLEAAIATRLASADYTAPANANITAIKAKTDNLPAAPADDTSIDTQLGTIAGYLDTEIAAIKAKTDNLPAAPADDTSIDTQLGTIAGYLDTEIAAIKAKTDKIPASPAAVGSPMILTSIYDAAKTAAQSGADGDTLKTISDQIDGISAGDAPTVEEIDDQLSGSHGSGVWSSGGDGGSAAITDYPVTDVTSSLPVLGAICELYPTDAYTGIMDSQITDASGFVTFNNLVLARRYYIKVIRAGYETFYDSEVAA
jgi:hypothetical protein